MGIAGGGGGGDSTAAQGQHLWKAEFLSSDLKELGDEPSGIHRKNILGKRISKREGVWLLG